MWGAWRKATHSRSYRLISMGRTSLFNQVFGKTGERLFSKDVDSPVIQVLYLI